LNAIENRHIAVIINPISGRKQSVSLFKNYLKPAFETVNLSYKPFVTTSSDWVNEWILGEEQKQFTEVVLIGGDGLYS